MHAIINWFEVYRIDYKVSYRAGSPVSVSPLGKLDVRANGNYWSVNGKRVSRKFGKALASYYA